MIQRRLRVSKWLNTTPAIGVCTLCSRELKVPFSALRRTADAQTDLQERFDRHRCEPLGLGNAANLLLRQHPDEEEDEEEDEGDGKEDDDDDEGDDGYSE